MPRWVGFAGLGMALDCGLREEGEARGAGHRAGLSHQVGGCAQFLAESSAVLRKGLASPRPPVRGSALTEACPDPE